MIFRLKFSRREGKNWLMGLCSYITKMRINKWLVPSFLFRFSHTPRVGEGSERDKATHAWIRFVLFCDAAAADVCAR